MTLFKNLKNQLHSIAAAPRLAGDALRFIVAGLLNTCITIIIYEIGLIFFEYRIAYSISWMVGIAIAVVFYPSKVFVGGRTTLVSKFLIMIVYVIVFFSGLLVLEQLKSYGVAASACIFFVIVFTTVVNFLLMRLVLRSRI